MCDTLFWELSRHYCVVLGLRPWVWPVVAVGVDGEHPDEGVPVVDVDEAFGLDDPYGSAGESTSDADEFASKADVCLMSRPCVRRPRAYRRVRSSHLRRRGEWRCRWWVQLRSAPQEPYRRCLGGVADVVVEPQPVEKLVEVFEVDGGAFIGRPVLEGAVAPFELAEGLGTIWGRVDQLRARTAASPRLRALSTTL